MNANCKLPERGDETIDDLSYAECLMEMGRFDLAEVAMRKRLATDPEDTFAWTRLATALQAMDRHVEAVLLFREAAGQLRTRVAILNWAHALLLAGRRDEAMQAYALTGRPLDKPISPADQAPVSR